MRKTVSVTCLALGFFLLILCAAFTVVQLTAAETAWFEQEFTKLSLAEDMGMTLGDLGASVRTLVNYLNGQTETIDVLVTVNGQQVRMFDLDIEIVHMREVKDLWQWFVGARNVGMLLAAVLCLIGVVLDGKDALRNVCWGYFWALGAFLVLAAFAGTWAAINFDSFWTAFHKVVFPDSENWLLPMESRMIQMLPSELFRDLVMRMGGRMLLIFLALAAVAVLILVIQQRRQQAKEALNMPQDRPKTPAEELAAVQGPDMLAVHKRANMTVSERRKLLEEQARQRQALATDRWRKTTTTMSYYDIARARLSALQQAGEATVLSIETSCDETAAALVKNGRQVLSNAVYTQIPIHRKFGGVVPELASRNHVDQVGPVVESALADAGLTLADVDAIAVTGGPGLVGALLVGVSYAKGLAFATGKPLVNTHHILGHIAANYLTFPDLQPPFTCLVASGGHSHIIEVADYDRCVLLGRTRDDAAGEAYDKVARVLELPYPGGPELEKLAQAGDPHAIRFHSAFNEGEGFDMSFSGLKTAVINHLSNAKQRGDEINRADVAASFQFAVNSILSDKAVRAAAENGHGVLALAGGVSANKNLRQMLAEKAQRRGIRFCCPDFKYCTDNGAMIGSAAFYLLMKGHIADLSFNAVPYLPIA